MSAAIEVRIFDTTSAQRLPDQPTMTLLFDNAITTVRALIARRVEAELKHVEARNNDKYLHGLIQPTAAEVRANGYDQPKATTLNVGDQVNNAIMAFGQNRFLLLVDDRQIMDLDEEFRMTDATKIIFLRLVPLVGG